MLNEEEVMKNLDRRDFPIGMFVVNFMSFNADGTVNKDNCIADYYTDLKPFNRDEIINKIQKLIDKDFPNKEDLEINFTGNFNVLNTEEEYTAKKEDNPDKTLFVAEALKDNTILRRYFLISAM